MSLDPREMGLRESQERSRNRESSRNREGNRLRDKQRGDLRERGERGERRERLKSRDKERGRNRDREKDFSNKDARKERFRSITGKDWGRNVTTVDEGAQHYAIIKSPMAYIPSCEYE